MQVKGEGLCDGKQLTSVVLCYQEVHAPRDDNEAEALLPAAYGEMIIYELPRYASLVPAWPLALQELVVCQINTHIESLRGDGAVSVENDTFVNAEGFGSVVSRVLDDQDGGGLSAHRSSSSQGEHGAAPHLPDADAASLQCAKAVSRRWQQTPVLPLATSMLSFVTQGDVLIVTCRCDPPFAWHLCKLALYSTRL